MRQGRAVLAVIVLIAIGLVGCRAVNVVQRGDVVSRQSQPDRGTDVVRAQARRGADMPGLEEHRIESGGLTRTYHVYVPPGISPGPRPLVVGFHGGGGAGLSFANRTGLRDMADASGFILALPDGVRGSWNTNSIYPQGYAEEVGIDDLSFVRQMLAEVTAAQNVDSSRIFAMGMSRGGMMSYLVGCEMPGQFAAIAAVAGTLSSGTCSDPGGASLLHIHGTQDERVPFEGGRGDFTARGQEGWASAREGIQIFATTEQCSIAWQSQQVTPDTVCQRTSCPGSAEVEYCLVQGGGHTWPGAELTNRQRAQGAGTSASFDATSYIAQFFLSQ